MDQFLPDEKWPDLPLPIPTNTSFLVIVYGLVVGLVFLYYLLPFSIRWWWPGSTVKRIKSIRASRFSPKHYNKHHFDTIVIGSGSGGSSCANILAQSGQRVLVLEQHEERTGGCTHTFRLEGCEWDTGLHYTSEGMALPTHRAGALLNFMTKHQQEWKRLQDPYDEVVFGDDSSANNFLVDDEGRLPNNNNNIFSHRYEFSAGAKNVIDNVIENINIDPNSSNANTLPVLRRSCEVWMDLATEMNQGFTALGIKRLLPRFLHFFVNPRVNRLYKLASYSVRDVQYAVFNRHYTIAQLLNDGCPKCPEGPEPDPILRRVKAVFNHPIGDYAVQPRVATMAAQGITMAHYMEGASYTVGPTQNLSIRLTSMVREMGGEVLCDATVTEIIVNEKTGRAVGVKVRKTSEPNSGEATEIYAKNIVCATSIFNLYRNLLPQSLPIVQEFEQTSTLTKSNGHVFLFCKIQGDAKDLQLPTHNLWYFHSYDMDQAFDQYFADPVHHRPPTCYIGFPCTKDPTWSRRYPGVSNCILISDGLYEWFTKWQNTQVGQRGQDYEAFKEQLTHHLLEILYETVPQVQGKVAFHTLGTPLTEVSYLASYQAGSYGTKCDLEMFTKRNSVWTTTPRTKVPGLTMAGSDAFLPAVCGAMYGGILGATSVLGRVGTVRMLLAFLPDFATALQKDNPKMSRAQAYARAIHLLGTEYVAN